MHIVNDLFDLLVNPFIEARLMELVLAWRAHNALSYLVVAHADGAWFIN